MPSVQVPDVSEARRKEAGRRSSVATREIHRHLYKVLVLVSLAPPPVHWVGIPEWKPPLEPPLDIEGFGTSPKPSEAPKSLLCPRSAGCNPGA